MKKILVVIASSIVALCGSSFTKGARTAVWFQLDPVAGFPMTNIRPTTTWPGCSGVSRFCARAYTSYITMSEGEYMPGSTVPNSTLLMF